MPIENYLANLKLPAPDSHKGQNGKLLIIGGSELFHAASKWSLDIASRLVDMVFYSSVPVNNDLIKEAKGAFWDGIVVPRENLISYLEEADVILIGPGMTRTSDTAEITNELLSRYPAKKWVIDAGALQMVNVDLLTASVIITPHRTEFEMLVGQSVSDVELDRAVTDFSQQHQQVCVLVKGIMDRVAKGEKLETIAGGNAGMTKGGTGDALAGLVAGLYCTHDALTAAVVGSYCNKLAGDILWRRVGPYFNASDLVAELPIVLWQVARQST